MKSQVQFFMLIATAALVSLVLPACEDDAVTPETESSEPLLARTQWYPASLPVAPSTEITSGQVVDGERVSLHWYNSVPPLTSAHRGSELARAAYAGRSTIYLEVDSIPSDSTAWAGIMRGFPITDPLDLSDYGFLKVWINDFKPDSVERSGVIFLEFGRMDENFYRPDVNQFDTEDPNLDGFTPLTEDTGLDGVPTGEPGDDVDDDFDPNPNPATGLYERINGTEGNRLFDSEDLDGTGTMERFDRYLRYRLDLSRGGPDPNGGPGWVYWVLVSDYEAVIPRGCCPQLHVIRHMRIWFSNIGEVIDPDARRIQLTIEPGVN